MSPITLNGVTMRRFLVACLMFGVVVIAPVSGSAGTWTLNDFTFHIYAPAGTHQEFKAQVYAWQGSVLGGEGGGAVGSALYSSTTMILEGNDAFNAVTITPAGGVSLVYPGSYVALLTVSDATDFAASNGATSWGLAPAFTHQPSNGGGGFVYSDNGNDLSQLTSEPWTGSFDFGDLAWTAHLTDDLGRSVTFDTVAAWDGTSTISDWGTPGTATYGQTLAIPEPSSIFVLGSGLLCLAVWRFRRIGGPSLAE
ncbi:MAG: PEP-CTERM sorting domain-containing protein [Planctomycetota bacterium]|nr:PEP-CTERM sorting domain-containing protein [Planctomycetota bacterium]